jgi:iron complex outermembrane receptor protein
MNAGRFLRTYSPGWRAVISYLCIIASLQAFADDEIDSAEFPVVLTASRMRQPLAEAPAAITVIDRETIEHSGVRQIADLLRLVPGAVVGYNDGNWPVATLRGLSATFASGLQVLVDGVSFYSPVFGGMLWENLPLSVDDIERIEVVRGPNAAIYGANSFLGVVNIITREPAVESGTEAISNIGNAGIRDLAVQHSGQRDGWRYRISGGRRADDGFNTRPDSAILNYVNLRAAYQVDAQNSLQVTYRSANTGKVNGDYVDNTAHTQFGRNHDLQLRWAFAESGEQETWVQYYHLQDSLNDRLRIDLKDLFSLPFSVPYEFEQDYMSVRDGIELQTTRRWNENLRSIEGFEMRRDAVASARFFGVAEERASFLTRAFANAQWSLTDKLTLHPALMYERNSLADNAWSPKLAATYVVTPGHTLRVSTSRAYRTPSLADEYADFKLSPPLVKQFRLSTGKANSESVFSKEIGYVFDLPDWSFGGDARIFSDRYRGLMSLRGGDAVNLDDAELSGADLSLRWAISDKTKVKLALARTYVHSTDIGVFYSASVPKNTISLFFDQTFADDLIFTVNYQHVSAMFWTDGRAPNLTPNIIPAIDHLNLRLAKRINLGDHWVEVAGVIQNALGHYRDYYVGSVGGTPNNVAQRIGFLQIKINY